MSTIDIRSLMRVRYNKKFGIINKLTESANMIKQRFENIKTIRDIKYIIESWSGISNNPDCAICQVINKLDMFNEQEQKEIINKLDNDLLYRASNNCLMNITEELSQKENPNYYLLNVLDKYRLYNRVNENYEKIDKKLGIGKIIRECGFNKFDDDTYRTKIIMELTESIFEAYSNVIELYRFNVTLESVLFAFNSIGIKADQTLLMKTITEYYVDNSSLSQDDMKRVITEMNLYSDEAKENTVSLFETEQKLSFGLVKQKANTIKELCESYRMNTKSVSNLKTTMTKIYARSLDECVENSPNILGIITTTITSLGMACIHPVLGILSAFTQYLISKDMDIKQTSKYLEELKDEKRKVQNKLDKKETEELKKYLERIDASIEKVQDYRTSLLSDEENEKEFDSYDDYDDDFLEQTFDVNYGLLSCISEAIENENYDAINIIHDIMTENKTLIDESGNLMNTVKLIKTKLKQSAEKLSTKEKALCSQMDNRFDLFVRDLQRSLSLEKRERVIKGKMGPSLSNIIKLATVGGISALINPAITAIGLFAGLALSKKATIREKQYILDEIGIQLKIVDRKINQAEMKGDDEALEELYRIQSRLQKEQKRIKYNIKLYHESGCVL